MTTVVVDLTVAAIAARCGARTYRGPAAVYVDIRYPQPGSVRYGDEAVAEAARRPRRVERYPAAWIDDDVVVIAGRLLAVDELLTGLLRDGVSRVAAAGADRLVLTVPSRWGASRRSRLRSCAELIAPRVALADSAEAVWAGSGPGGARAVVVEAGPLGTTAALVVDGQVHGSAFDAELTPQDLDHHEGAARAADLVGAVLDGNWQVSEVLVTGPAPTSLQFEWALRERGLTGIVDVAAPDAALRGAERVGLDESRAEPERGPATVAETVEELPWVEAVPWSAGREPVQTLGEPEPGVDRRAGRRWASGRALAALAAGVLVVTVAVGWLVWPRSDDTVTAEPAVTAVPTTSPPKPTPEKSAPGKSAPGKSAPGKTAPGTTTTPPTPTVPSQIVTDHRVSLQVPTSWWETDRAAVGRASRLRVEGPDGSRLMLVQNKLDSGADQEDVAAQLRRTVADRGPSNFDGFDPSASYGGRDVVEYREHTTSGSTVNWHVLVLDGLQVSVGCEPAARHPSPVDEVCEQAIRTLRVAAG